MEKAIEYKEVTLFYRVFGKGDPVVLLHGVAEDGNIWQQQVAALENNYTLIIPDLPGSGRSAGNGTFGIEDLADAVQAIVAAEGVKEAVFIGHSMGGYVVLAFAEKYPIYVRAFCLFHSSAFADPADKKKTREKNILFIEKHGSYAFLRQSVPTLFSDESRKCHPQLVDDLIEQYKDFDPASMAAYQQAMMLRPDRTAVLKQFVKPVLFIIGKYDNAIPFVDSLKQCHLPVLSYIHILHVSGHMGMLEETAKSNMILKNFLQDVYVHMEKNS